MSDIVTRLRTWVFAVHSVPVSDLLDEAADEIERLRLTDAEREAVAWSASCASDREHPAEATLRGLLKRLSP
jgi:hypothetical protein